MQKSAPTCKDRAHGVENSQEKNQEFKNPPPSRGRKMDSRRAFPGQELVPEYTKLRRKKEGKREKRDGKRSLGGYYEQKKGKKKGEGLRNFLSCRWKRLGSPRGEKR